MDLETDKLHCSKHGLQELVRTLRENMVEVSAKYNTLTLYTHGALYRNSSSPRSTVRISIPYTGHDYVCYSKREKLIDDLDSPRVLALLNTNGKPLGWQDDYPSFKTATCVAMNPAEVLESLNFVLRLDQDECEPQLQGIVFNAGEILATDRQSIHVSLLTTPLTAGPALCERGALETLQELLSSPFDWVLEGFFKPPQTKKDRFDQGALFFRLTESSGIRVEITSTSKIATHDLTKGRDETWIRAPITAEAVSFSIPSSFLQELCTFAMKKKRFPLLYLSPGAEELSYEIYGVGDMDTAVANKGTVPLIWGPGNRYATPISLDPEKILCVLKKSTDEYAQFIIPPHPDTGFEYFEINPVYLNTNPKNFAVISQMVRAEDKDRLEALQNKKQQKVEMT